MPRPFLLVFLLTFAAAADDQPPAMTPMRKDVKPFEYVEAKVPFYPPGKAWGTAESRNKMQKPFEPSESVKHMVTPVGFEARLFASEPQLGGKPICMNWDERGRLWVAVTVDYPNERQPEGQGRDRIVICEDTDGDGQANKFTVFADKLSIPTSLLCSNGRAIVHQSPHTLFLKDTNGDDVADERAILLTGWGTSDTHAGPSNLHYGLDNWIYGIVGYAGAKMRESFGQGFYRFRFAVPEGPPPRADRKPLPVEFLRSTNNNSWGVGFSEDGLLFGSTANGNPSVHLPIPNRYYEAVRGWSSSVLDGIAGDATMWPITENVRQVDFHGRFTAAAGHALYTARTYPREYWNRTAFVCEPTGHLVATFTLEPNGGSFRSRNAWNLLASDDEWTSPIAAEVGPDGNVWVIDWYNYIVQHNPTPPGHKTGKGNAYETHLRDKTHGRIYRIVYKDAKPQRPMSLAGASLETLVATLKHPNMLWRTHAQRLILERGDRTGVPALIELVKDPTFDEIGLNVGAIHALWTLQGMGALYGEPMPEALAAAVRALKHRSAAVRRNAVQVLPPLPTTVDSILEARLLNDPDGQVRLATLLALADQPTSEKAGQAIGEFVRRRGALDDRWIRDAATCAAAKHDLHFLKYLTHPNSEPLSSVHAFDLIQRIAEHFARGGPKETAPNLILASLQADPQTAGAIVRGLSRGWPNAHPATLDDATGKALGELLKKLPTADRGALVLLTSRWGSTALEKDANAIVAGFLAEVRNESAKDAARIEAAVQVIGLRKGDPEAFRQLLDALTPRMAPELAGGILEALRRSEAGSAGAMLAQRLPSLTPALRASAVRSLLSRTEWTTALLDVLEKALIQASELTADQKQALASHPDKKIAERAKAILERGGVLPDADRQKVVVELSALTRRTGNAQAGKAVFAQHCAKCHIHSGEGAKVGPDLSGVAVHSKDHLLVEILDPSRSVEGNYRQFTVATKDGRILTGLLASENRSAIEIIDVEAKTHTVQRQDIEELVPTKKSLMPDGFEKQLKPDELIDLLEFLTQRGKFLPLSLAKVATAVSTRGMFNREDSTVERLAFEDWKPKTVDGVPFHLVDPQGDRTPNVLLLHGPQGTFPPRMPKTVRIPCNAPARAIHLLSGVNGWGFPGGRKGAVSMLVRVHYEDGESEEHLLRNGEHFADYIRRVDVPASKFAFDLHGRQIRYLAVHPKRTAIIKTIEFTKGPDDTAPIVMAVTVELPEK